MFLLELIFAFLIALVLSLVFAVGFRGHGWGAGLLFFFVLLFLFTWAGGIWVTPAGPLLVGIPWMSFLFVGLVVALLLAALIPTEDRRPRTEEERLRKEGSARAQTWIALDALFWVLIGGLILMILFRYFIR